MLSAKSALIMKEFFFLPLVFLGSVLILASCEEKGPMEKAGENIDNAAEELTE